MILKNNVTENRSEAILMTIRISSWMGNHMECINPLPEPRCETCPATRLTVNGDDLCNFWDTSYIDSKSAPNALLRKIANEFSIMIVDNIKEKILVEEQDEER